jgi:hypothetical protein
VFRFVGGEDVKQVNASVLFVEIEARAAPPLGRSIQMEKQLIEEISDGVATLRFNRPDRLNALLTLIMEGLLEALPRLARDARVGVIVPTWWRRE